MSSNNEPGLQNKSNQNEPLLSPSARETLSNFESNRATVQNPIINNQTELNSGNTIKNSAAEIKKKKKEEEEKKKLLAEATKTAKNAEYRAKFKAKYSDPAKGPYEKSWIFSKLFFLWLNPIISLGKKLTFDQDLHYKLRPTDNIELELEKFSKLLEEELKKPNPKNRNIFFATLRRMYGVEFCWYVVLGIFYVLAQFSSSYLIYKSTKTLIDGANNINNDSNGIISYWDIAIFTSLIIVSRLSISLFYNQLNFLLYMLGYRIRAIATGQVFKKCFKISSVNNGDFTFGDIVNLISVDANRFALITNQLAFLFVYPFQLIIGFISIGLYVGIAIFPGIGLLCITSIFTGYLGVLSKTYNDVYMKCKDKRMKVTTEIFNSIRFIKFNAWENIFLRRLNVVRNEELVILRKNFLRMTISIFWNWLSPGLFLITVFAYYVLTSGDMQLQNVFGSLNSFMIMSETFRILPFMIFSLFTAATALQRIDRFLVSPEIDLKYLTREPNSEDCAYALQIEKGNFYWNPILSAKQKEEEEKKKKLLEEQTKKSNKKNKPAPESDKNQIEQSQNKAPIVLQLKNMSIKIPKGKFVAIIGVVGSGKSSFCYSLFGDMNYLKDEPHNIPRVLINGSISYVSQKSWIRNDTIKENVIFNLPFDQEKFDKTIHVSAMEDDLKIMPKESNTQLGDKGINLSGGQKARVTIARAVYSNSDIIILDDPISAVDVNVGKFLVKQCFLKYLSGKTRVLITHAISYLKYVDYVYIFKDGQVEEEGTYELIKNTEVFKKLAESLKEQEARRKDAESSKKNVPNLTNLQPPHAKSVISKEKENIEEIEAENENSDIEDKIETIEHIHKSIKLLENNESTSKSIQEADKKNVQSAQNEKGNNSEPALKAEETTIVKSEQEKIIEDIIQAEDRALGRVSKTIYFKYIKYNGGACYFIILLFVMTIWMFLYAGSNYWLQYWSVKDENLNGSINNVFYLGVYIGLVLTFSFVTLFRTGGILYRNASMSARLHKLMAGTLLHASIPNFFDRVPIGRILNRFSKDIDIVDFYLAMSANYFFLISFMLLSDFIIAVYASSFYMIIFVGIFMIIAFWLQDQYMATNREVTRLDGITRSPVIQIFSETLNGLSIIRAFGQEKNTYKQYMYALNENQKNAIIMSASSSWFSVRLCLCSLVVIVPCILWGFIFNIKLPSEQADPDIDKINKNIGLFSLMLNYLFLLTDDISSFLQNISYLETRLISLERCWKYTQVEPEPGYKHFQKEKKDMLKEIFNEIIAPIPGWPGKGEIIFKNFSLRYRKDLDLVLNDINIKIAPGEKIGIIGRTGAGKTTLINSIIRAVEGCEGSICIDGQNIHELDLKVLRTQITVLTQDPYLFIGTIKENVDPIGIHTDEQVWEVLEKVSLKEKFMNLETKLGSPIDQGGENLSFGERQLVCMARALLKRSVIVLMDEATSNMDVSTEELLEKSTKELFKHSTVLTIAHRVNTIYGSDKILVLDKGKVMEFGKTSDLMNNKESYFSKVVEETLKEYIN